MVTCVGGVNEGYAFQEHEFLKRPPYKLSTPAAVDVDQKAKLGYAEATQ